LPYATFQRARLAPSSAAAARSAPRSSRTTNAIGFRDFALAYASAAATIFCAWSSFSPIVLSYAKFVTLRARTSDAS